MLSKIKSKLNTVNNLISYHLIRNGYFAKKGDKKFIIVMYHGIDKHQNTKYNERFFNKNIFEKQIISFKKHFNILSHNDFTIERFSAKKMNMVITFDDGYLNNFQYALPILDKYNVHAYFFITGIGQTAPGMLWADAVDIVSKHAMEKSKIEVNGNIFELFNCKFINKGLNINLKSFIKDSKTAGYAEKELMIEQLLSLYDFTKTHDLEDYWKLMDNEQICKASESRNITIGSHGFYHNNLGSLSNGDAIEEVKSSKSYLENVTQKEMTSIAFPDGSYTQDLNTALYGIGFKKQFLVDYCFSDAGSKDYVYDRFGLYPYMGNNHQLLHKILY